MFKLIEGRYLGDILAQPDALTRTVHGLPDTVPQLIAKARDGGFGRIVLTGMGSSLHALYPLHLTLIELGLPSLQVETAELCLYMPRLLAENVLVVAVSQSGRSAEIIALLDLIGPEARLLAVTNDAASPLAARADEVVLTQAGPEATVSCKTYVTTLLVLEWLAAGLTGALDAARRDLREAAPAVASYVSSWPDHVAALAALVEGAEQIYLVGRGRSLAAACTGGLIAKEATRASAEGMSSAAFRHGPFEVLGPHVFVAVLSGDEAGGALNARLVADIRAAGGRAHLIGSVPTAAPFLLPLSSNRLTPILEILPIQMLTLAVAAARGEEAGTFRLASKVTVIA